LGCGAARVDVVSPMDKNAAIDNTNIIFILLLLGRYVVYSGYLPVFVCTE
jgi:hypothetical protein